MQPEIKLSEKIGPQNPFFCLFFIATLEYRKKKRQSFFGQPLFALIK